MNKSAKTGSKDSIDDILDELVMQGATYIDELFRNPHYVRAYKKAKAYCNKQVLVGRIETLEWLNGLFPDEMLPEIAKLLDELKKELGDTE